VRRAGILIAGACLLSAQQADEVRVSAHAYAPPLHLTAQTSLVQLEVVVRDARGHARGGMTQGDFEVFDQGKPRDIAAFSVEARAALGAVAPAPVTAGTSTTAEAVPVAKTAGVPRRFTMLFFDDLHGTAGDLQRTQAAARRFIKEGMGPGARAAIYGSSEGLTLDFTADADALTAAIDKLRAHQKYSENGLMPCPRITPYQAFLIDNNLSVDALTAAVNEEQACGNADPSLRKGGRRTSMGLSTDPKTASVRAQAAATWQQARAESLDEFDAVENALALLARAPGTRVLLVVSTGFLSGLMDRERSEAIDHAVHAGIVINALDAKGLWSEAPGRPFDQPLQTVGGLPLETFAFETSTIGSRNDAMNEAMEEFASGTGGLFFHNNNDLVDGFAQLASVPETTYLLAIHPDLEGAAGKYHKLKVRLTSKSSDYVQTRPGYFAPSNAPSTAPEGRPLDKQLLTSDVLNAIPIQLSARTGKTEKGDPTVSMLIHVDLATLKFTQHEDRHVQRLMFIGALLDSSGKTIAAKEGAMELALKDDTLARLTASGVNAGLTFAAPAGPYTIRVVVQDADGKMASQNQTVEIPK
jgi:VWFA-related protein